jgi:hypothetical protein
LIRLPRPLWIGLATVVLVVVAIGLRIGVPIYRQHVAIREIERLGAYVITSPVGPKWLRARLGNDAMKLFDEVTFVDFRGTRATDATMDHVSCLKSMTGLSLHGTQITDAGLAHLKGLPNLYRLSLFNTQVTDAGLAHLKGLNRLDDLFLDRTLVTDAGLAQLRDLPRPERLGPGEYLPQHDWFECRG